eukprot:6179300-Pleurochrysis_carterae.AAC.1
MADRTFRRLMAISRSSFLSPMSTGPMACDVRARCRVQAGKQLFLRHRQTETDIWMKGSSRQASQLDREGDRETDRRPASQPAKQTNRPTDQHYDRPPPNRNTCALRRARLADGRAVDLDSADLRWRGRTRGKQRRFAEQREEKRAGMANW